MLAVAKLCSSIVVNQVTTTKTQQNLLFHPSVRNYNFIEEKQMLGVLATRNNLTVKNTRQPLKRKDI